MTSPIAGLLNTATAAPTPSRAPAARQTDFLKLIAAQLQYQNPMEPTKDTEFIAQMAQFDSLQKMEDVAKSLASLLSISQMSQTSTLIGKRITARVNGEEITGLVSKVTFADGDATLHVGGKRVALGSVTEIANERTE
jgi:flagellar basal-body rod modification protein FlgD